MSAKEHHLIIDWAIFFTADDLTTHINEANLELLNIIKINKLEDRVKILSKFYNAHVDDFRGETDFNIYLVLDESPVYEDRKALTRGNQRYKRVNTKLFDLKQKLRKISAGDGSFRVHATNNIQETKDNLRALGVFNEYYPQKKFSSLSEVFEELDSENKLRWLVMRNFEQMPDEITIDKHLDVDLLVNDYYLAKAILDGDSATSNRYEDGGSRILNNVYINNQKVLFDLRHVGDHYYDLNFQKDMLDTRAKYKNFHIPDERRHLYSLIYHAIIQKRSISQTYIDVFLQYGISKEDINKKSLRKMLDQFMEKNGYKYVRPEPSVGFYA